MAKLKPIAGSDTYLWKYLPSVPLAVVFLVLFLAINVAHCWRLVRSRAWYCTVFAVGGLLQIVGYAVRIHCHAHTEQIGACIVQSVLILLAPILYAASIYMVLARIVRSVPGGEDLSPIRPTRMTALFVLGDLLSLIVQGNGAGMAAKAESKAAGEWVVTGGLLLQLGVFGCFVLAAAVFHRRLRRREAGIVVTNTKTSGFSLRRRPDDDGNNDNDNDNTGANSVPWRQGLTLLYACSALIAARSVFRIVEYVMGTDGYLLAHEWPMYAFDAAPMWLVQLIFCVWFPHRFSRGRGRGRGRWRRDEDRLRATDEGHVLVGR